MSQRSRVNGDTIENGPRVDAYLFILIRNVRFQKDLDTCGCGHSDNIRDTMISKSSRTIHPFVGLKFPQRAH